LIEGKNAYIPLQAGEEFEAAQAEHAKQADALREWYTSKLNVIWLTCLQGEGGTAQVFGELPKVETVLQGDPKLPELLKLREQIRHGLDLAASFQRLKLQWDLKSVRKVTATLALIPAIPEDVKSGNIVMEITKYLTDQSAEKKQKYAECADKMLQTIFGVEDAVTSHAVDSISFLLENVNNPEAILQFGFATRLKEAGDLDDLIVWHESLGNLKAYEESLAVLAAAESAGDLDDDLDRPTFPVHHAAVSEFWRFLSVWQNALKVGLCCDTKNIEQQFAGPKLNPDKRFNFFLKDLADFLKVWDTMEEVSADIEDFKLADLDYLQATEIMKAFVQPCKSALESVFKTICEVCSPVFNNLNCPQLQTLEGILGVLSENAPDIPTDLYEKMTAKTGSLNIEQMNGDVSHAKKVRDELVKLQTSLGASCGKEDLITCSDLI